MKVVTTGVLAVMSATAKNACSEPGSTSSTIRVGGDAQVSIERSKNGVKYRP